jgi:hypothetical protein
MCSPQHCSNQKDVVVGSVLHTGQGTTCSASMQARLAPLPPPAGRRADSRGRCLIPPWRRWTGRSRAAAAVSNSKLRSSSCRAREIMQPAFCHRRLPKPSSSISFARVLVRVSLICVCVSCVCACACVFLFLPPSLQSAEQRISELINDTCRCVCVGMCV